jgi:hypothetical protein
MTDDTGKQQASSAESAESQNGCLPLLGGPEFPIGIFWPPPPQQTTIERYQEIKDAGFTFVITGNYLNDNYIINWALSQADAVGLKVLVSDDISIYNLTHLFNISDDRSVSMSITTADVRELIKRALDAHAGHPSLVGFNLFDEPGDYFFPNLGKAFAILRSMSPDTLPYVNLPDAEWTTPDNWRAYVERFIQIVQPSLISFDQYPVRPAGLDTSYFTNWAIFRDLGLKYGVPTWTFIQSVSSGLYRQPTSAEMMWQINVSLAYGAKGIQYFTYWTPDPARGEGFGPALVTLDGRLTTRYHVAKEINTNWLSRVGRQLKPLVSERVVHVEDPAPAEGMVCFTPDDYLTDVSGDPLIIGQFRSADQSVCDRWLLVVNRLMDTSANARLSVEQDTVCRVDVFDPKSESFSGQEDSDKIRVSLQPGEAALYRLVS